MAAQIEIWLIAAVAAIGLIAGGRAIITGLMMSRRPAHPDMPQSDHPSASADIPPPAG